MMRSPQLLAIAVRKEDGRIALHVSETKTRKGWVMKCPIVRGVINFIDMLRMGVFTFTKATSMLGLEEEEPGRFSQWISGKTGKSADSIMMGTAMVLGLALAIGLFFILPSLATQWMAGWVDPMVRSLCTGAVRLVIFFLYLWLTARMKEIQRVFQYHGAEHMTIFTYENELPLTVENARKQSRLHPRCGTSFLLIVMMISILVFSVIRSDELWIQVVGRVALLPVVTGISYEVLKFLAKHENPVCRALRWPGMQLQRLTTRVPDDSMLEVAIAAFKAADGQAETTEDYDAFMDAQCAAEAADPQPDMRMELEQTGGV